MIQPGQTIYMDFFVQEDPDALPTVRVYQSTAEGVYEEINNVTHPGLNPEVIMAQLGHYYSSMNVPTDAMHGTRYTLVVTALFGGESETIGLDGGTVDVLTSAQQLQLDTIQAVLPDVPPGTENGFPLLELQPPITSGGPLPYILATQNVVRELAKYNSRINSLPKNDELHDLEGGAGEPGGLPLLDANGNWLAPSQQDELTETHAKTQGLGSGSAVAINPVGAGGTVRLYRGIDYTAETTPIDIPDSSPSMLPDAGTAVTLTATADTTLDNPNTFNMTGEVILDGTVKKARFTCLAADMGPDGNYIYLVHHEVEVGTEVRIKLALKGNMVVLRGL